MITKEQAEAMDGHTPGPWRVGPVDDTRVEDADGYEVAQIDGDYNEPDLWPKMEANARLIAAAPDLLATVIALHERVERLTEANGVLEDALQEAGDDYPGSSMQGWCRQQIAQARAIVTPAAPACAKCGGTMHPGIATGQTYTAGTPDFGPDDEISTMSAGGPGVVIPAMKCEKCGWSVTE